MEESPCKKREWGKIRSHFAGRAVVAGLRRRQRRRRCRSKPLHRLFIAPPSWAIQFPYLQRQVLAEPQASRRRRPVELGCGCALIELEYRSSSNVTRVLLSSAWRFRLGTWGFLVLYSLSHPIFLVNPPQFGFIASLCDFWVINILSFRLCWWFNDTASWNLSERFLFSDGRG